MKRYGYAGIAVGAVVMYFTTIAVAGDAEIAGKFEGTLFTDWAVEFQKGLTASGKDTTFVSHGFENQRAYFGYKTTVNKKFVGRILFDVGRLNELTSASTTFDTATSTVKTTTKKDSRLEAYAKYAYLQIKDLVPITSVALGLQGRYQFKFQESFWGSRYLYKSFMDEKKYGSSADLGLGVAVKPSDQFELYLNVDNGEGYKKPQLDKAYKTALGVRLLPVEPLEIYAYGDVMPFEDEDKDPQFTAAGFVGVRPSDAFRIGLEYDYQGNHQGDSQTALNGISAYTILTFKPVKIFARLDLFSTDTFETMAKDIIAGLEYAPVKNLALSPNLQVAIPAGEDPKPTTKILLSGQYKF